MQAILETLGLNWAGFLWHLANFLVLLVLLRLVLWRPLTRMLDQRAQRIRESLQHADLARHQAEQAEADRQALLVETRREAEQIRHRADEQGRKIVSDAEAAAQQRAEQILAQAQANAETLREQMVAELRGQVADLIVSAVERVTRDALDSQSQRVLVQQFLTTEPLNGPASRN